MTDTNVAETIRYKTHDAPLPSGNIRYHRSGEGRLPTLLFLHGSGPGVSALSNWEGAIQRLGDRFDCVAPDVLGFGHSTHPDPPPRGMAAFTAARVGSLFELLDHLGLDRVDLVGNSMDGLLSLEMALAQPDRIGRMTLMGSAGIPFAPTPDLLRLVTFYDDPSPEALSALLRCFLHDPAHSVTLRPWRGTASSSLSRRTCVARTWPRSRAVRTGSTSDALAKPWSALPDY